MEQVKLHYGKILADIFRAGIDGFKADCKYDAQPDANKAMADKMIETAIAYYESLSCAPKGNSATNLYESKSPSVAHMDLKQRVQLNNFMAVVMTHGRKARPDLQGFISHGHIDKAQPGLAKQYAA